MTQTREEIEAKIAKLQAQLEEMDKRLVIFNGYRPTKGQAFFTPALASISGFMKADFSIESIIERCIFFRTSEQAAAVADAIYVMLELRNQPGAFSRSDGGRGYLYQYFTEGIDLTDYGKGCLAFVCPPFPSQEACDKAVDVVGRERVERALKLWAGVPL